MNSDLQILSNTHQQLMVHSPNDVFTWISLIIVVGLSGMFLFVYFTAVPSTSPASRRIYLIVAALVPIGVLAISVWTHTADLSRTSGMCTIINKFAGITYSTQQVPLSQMERAVMESARPGTRIAIVMRDGSTIFPFGKAYNPKPSQYKVIDLINGFLNVGGSGGSTIDDAEEHFRKLREKQAAEAAKSQHRD